MNQSIFYRSKSLEQDEIEMVLDPNALNEEGTAAITNITFSQDGARMIYAISYNGCDWQEVKIRDLSTGKDFPEVLKWCVKKGNPTVIILVLPYKGEGDSQTGHPYLLIPPFSPNTSHRLGRILSGPLW